MKLSDNLFELIKSLNKTEKGYFKKSAGFHTIGSKNNYLRLFEFIEKQKEYDEQKVRKYFANEPMLNNLSVAKIYLYDLIMESLESYSRNSSVELKLKSYLHQARILFNKTLYGQCRDLVDKAYKLALKYDKVLEQVELLNWRIKLNSATSYLNQIEIEITEPFLKINETLGQYSNYMAYFREQEKMFLHHIQARGGGGVRQNAEIEKIVRQQMFKDPRKAISDEAKYYYNMAWSVYYFSRHDYLNSYSCTKKLLALYENAPHKIKDNEFRHFNNLFNLMLCEHHLGKYDELTANIEKIKNIETNSSRLKYAIQYSSYNFQMMKDNHYGDFNSAIQMIEEKRTLENLKPPYDRYKTDFIYMSAMCYFGAKEYLKAKRNINRILNEKLVDENNALYTFLKVFKLILQFETGDTELISYTVRSTYYFLSKRKRLYKFENLVLDFIGKKLPKVNTRQELNDAFSKLKRELEELKKIPFEKSSLSYFDIISWLESKIQNRSFAEVVREKVLSKNR